MLSLLIVAPLAFIAGAAIGSMVKGDRADATAPAESLSGSVAEFLIDRLCEAQERIGGYRTVLMLEPGQT